MGLVGILAFVSVSLLTFSVLTLAFSEEGAVKRSLRRMSEYEGTAAQEAEPLLSPFRSRVLGAAAASAAGRFGSLLPAERVRTTRAKLHKAGRYDISPTTWVFARPVMALSTAGGFTLVSLLRPLPVGRWFLLAAVAFGIGWMLPGMWLNGKIEKRQKDIKRSLPEMLDMLTISVEAGLGFDAALTKLITHKTGPLAEEFAAALQEVQAGVPRREALKSLSERVDVAELSAFLMAVVQADVFGVSIAKVLKTQAQELRTKRRQRAEESAQKIPVKIVFPVVLCILPATMLVILGPAAIGIGRVFGLID